MKIVTYFESCLIEPIFIAKSHEAMKLFVQEYIT